MPRFIPIDKMKQLRDASRNGDLNAKKILDMQLGGTEDFGPLMDEYFAPKQETPTPIVEEKTATEVEADSPYKTYLRENELEDNDDNRAEFENVTGQKVEMPKEKQEHCECECLELMKKLSGEELDAIDSYSKAITQIMASANLNDIQKRKIISRLKEIRGDEEEHARELGELTKICEGDVEETIQNENI